MNSSIHIEAFAVFGCYAACS